MSITIEKNKIIEYIGKLPGFSSTMTKIIDLANDPTSQPKDLVQAISLDPILTAKILKLINSAYFGMSSEVVSVNRAVILLGLNTIKNLALSSAIASALRIQNRHAPFTNEQFWEHNLACGVGSKLLAQKMGINKMNWEEYFICGLLHDIGKIIFVELFPEEYRDFLDELKEKDRPDILEEEEKTFGTTHPEIGVIIAEKWKLPQLLVEAIREHHNPNLNDPQNLSHRVAVYLANNYCNRDEIGIKLGSYAPEINPLVWDHFPLKPEEVKNTMGELPTHVEQAKVFLQN
jgi:putative nucleotidyltransferase with HDIG domain